MSYIKKLSPLWRPFAESLIGSYSAAAAFYLLLSALPAMTVIISLLPPSLQYSEVINSLILMVIPQDLYPLINSVWDGLYRTRTVGTISISLVFTLWSSSKGILSITDGLNTILGFSHKSWLKRRLEALICLILFLISMLLASFVVVGGVALKDTQIISALTLPFMLIFRYRSLMSFLLLSIVLALVLRFLPSDKLDLSNCLIGGCAASAAWVISSHLFSIYIKHFSNWSRSYGILGLLLLTALWIRLCVWLLLCGGLIAALRQKKSYHPIRIVISALKRE